MKIKCEKEPELFYYKDPQKVSGINENLTFRCQQSVSVLSVFVKNLSWNEKCLFKLLDHIHVSTSYLNIYPKELQKTSNKKKC